MNELMKELKDDLRNEDARHEYADTIANAFIAAQIRALREERKLTQEELAQLTGTKQSGISRFQKADYSGWKVETLRKFAKAFGVRLRVSFEEFGSLPSEISGFTKERLTPRKFEDDPAFAEADSEAELQAFIDAPLEAAKAQSIGVQGGFIGDDQKEGRYPRRFKRRSNLIEMLPKRRYPRKQDAGKQRTATPTTAVAG